MKRKLITKEIMSTTTMNDKTTFSSLEDARKYTNLTQNQLSQKTGITQCDISKIERNKANPTINVLQRLANAMNMKIRIVFEKVE